jgi:prepilin signal peptidase PulO-like enzyme (type II secretory pathway)
MGMGDVKLALLLGFGVGSAVPVAIVAALLAAAVPSAVLLLRNGARGRAMTIPFGPFLALGGVLALVAGGPLLDAYLKAL